MFACNARICSPEGHFYLVFYFFRWNPSVQRSDGNILSALKTVVLHCIPSTRAKQIPSFLSLAAGNKLPLSSPREGKSIRASIYCLTARLDFFFFFLLHVESNRFLLFLLLTLSEWISQITGRLGIYYLLFIWSQYSVVPHFCTLHVAREMCFTTYNSDWIFI